MNTMTMTGLDSSIVRDQGNLALPLLMSQTALAQPVPNEGATRPTTRSAMADMWLWEGIPELDSPFAG